MFYLGTHEPLWLQRTSVPLFVSRSRIAGRCKKNPPKALGRWALDSGGFTEIHKFGEWVLTARDYADEVIRYADEMGNLDWAAPQDWMCEPSALKASGLTVADHQRNTVNNFLELRDVLGVLVIPVIQGWSRDDYLRNVDQYEAAGVDLSSESLIGLGSICRRNREAEIAGIISILHPLQLHGFGVKGAGLINNAKFLKSADSMAWSFSARYEPPLKGCSHPHCNNCIKYALKWRESLLSKVEWSVI
ncbi:MAG: hypothetical protein HOD58_16630 [Gammaproteobacteria bacterium]|jgi:hypothetical protein|nr:hypothetical protein [Gammaproteobacteria bacterium]